MVYFVYSNLLGIGETMLKNGSVPHALGLWWVHARHGVGGRLPVVAAAAQPPAVFAAFEGEARMMPSLLDRLIARQILHSTLLVLNVLVALAVFFIMIDALKDYGNANFKLVELIKYVVLRQPQQVYELAPIAALIGTIMGLSTLALNSELTAMRAAGVSVARIVLATMKVGLLYALVILLVGEYVVPVSENLAQTGRAQALETPLQKKSSGIWLRSGTSFVNIGEVLPDFSLLRMNIYEFGQDNRLRTQISARRARYEDGVWRLQKVKESLIVGNEAVQTRSVPEEDWHTALTPDVVSVFAIRPDSLSIQQLHYYIGHLQPEQPGHAQLPAGILAEELHAARHSHHGAAGHALCIPADTQRRLESPRVHRHHAGAGVHHFS